MYTWLAYLPGVVTEHLQGPRVQQQATPGEQAVGRQLQGGRAAQGFVFHGEVHYCLPQVCHAAVLRHTPEQGPTAEGPHQPLGGEGHHPGSWKHSLDATQNPEAAGSKGWHWKEATPILFGLQVLVSKGSG